MAGHCIVFVLAVMSLFCNVMGSGLRGRPWQRRRKLGRRDIQNTTLATPGPELSAILDEYGSLIADGELFKLTEPGLLYTWDGFVEGVNVYNSMAMQAEPEQRTFLGEPDVTLNTMTLFVIMAHLQAETAMWSACKERVRNADGTCPAQDGGGCSEGRINSYTPERAAEEGFEVVVCNGAEGPANGCVDEWGRVVEDAKNCWWGRGATQLTWPGNYDALQALVQSAAGVDICVDPDRICDDEIIAWVTAIGYWMLNDGPWREGSVDNMPYTFDASLEVIRPEDQSSNQRRKDTYEEYLVAAGITEPPVVPPPPSGTTIVQPEEGCFQIADRVCGNGNFARVICNPPACNPEPALGSEVEYDCSGC